MVFSLCHPQPGFAHLSRASPGYGCWAISQLRGTIGEGWLSDGDQNRGRYLMGHDSLQNQRYCTSQLPKHLDVGDLGNHFDLCARLRERLSAPSTLHDDINYLISGREQSFKYRSATSASCSIDPHPIHMRNITRGHWVVWNWSWAFQRIGGHRNHSENKATGWGYQLIRNPQVLFVDSAESTNLVVSSYLGLWSFPRSLVNLTPAPYTEEERQVYVCKLQRYDLRFND